MSRAWTKSESTRHPSPTLSRPALNGNGTSAPRLTGGSERLASRLCAGRASSHDRQTLGRSAKRIAVSPPMHRKSPSRFTSGR
jgi:hypothetical protein